MALTDRKFAIDVNEVLTSAAALNDICSDMEKTIPSLNVGHYMMHQVAAWVFLMGLRSESTDKLKMAVMQTVDGMIPHIERARRDIDRMTTQ